MFTESKGAWFQDHPSHNKIPPIFREVGILWKIILDSSVLALCLHVK